MSSNTTESKQLRIVLWGKAGAGKSSAGNTILGKDAFKAKLSFNPVTKECKTAENDDKGLLVVDTPGLFNTKEAGDITNMLLESSKEAHPGPHAILLVMKLDQLTKEDEAVLNFFKEALKEVLPYTIILFTHGDKKSLDVEKLIQDSPSLQYIDKKTDKYHVFTNEKSFTKDDPQVENLLEKIRKMKDNNGGSCYSNKHLEMAVKNEKLAESLVKPQQKMSMLEKWQQVPLEKLKENVPGLREFLDYLTKVAMKCMPK